jgi:choline dehydrogenase-like flavoprotein
MVAITDPILAGLQRGWKVVDASTLEKSLSIEADVVIIGTGAGGAISADILSRAGLQVVLIEEGPLRSSQDFRMQEAQAYSDLYWDSAARKTEDKAITILQGRTVGGSTTVNWTSCFRTPESTLQYWSERHGITGYGSNDLVPWFQQIEQRLNIAPWALKPNANNSLLQIGAQKLGISTHTIARNVKGCWNLGYCGMGCPTNAKQSMLVSCVPDALDRGAQLFTRCRAWNFSHQGGKITQLNTLALAPDGLIPKALTLSFKARHYILAAGAINSPALLLRSHLPDPYELTGSRTFLHPVVISAALMPQPVQAWQGAPQSVYTDHFLQRPFDGAMAFKLEAPPIHPVLFATTLQGFGTAHADIMRQFTYVHAQLALMRDGFHEESPGGQVKLRSDGSGVLDYNLNDYFWRSAREALLAMAEIQFAAGAKKVYSVHELCSGYGSWQEAKQAISALPMKAGLTRVVSAHVMGGCRFGSSERDSVVQLDGRHWHIRNLSVHDGSLFPTSIGANPQLSIYAIAARLSHELQTGLS